MAHDMYYGDKLVGSGAIAGPKPTAASVPPPGKLGDLAQVLSEAEKLLTSATMLYEARFGDDRDEQSTSGEAGVIEPPLFQRIMTAASRVRQLAANMNSRIGEL